MESKDWAEDFVRRVMRWEFSGEHEDTRASDVRKLFAAELRARVGGWQPIETAPKDGTAILAIIAGSHPLTKEPFIPAVAFFDEGWVTCESCDIAGTDGEMAYQPTHWMPLPAAPAEGGG